MRIFILLLLIISQLFSQQQKPGTLSGVVLDSETKQPIFGVNVLLENTFLGSATNPDGKFIIKNIKPGKYTLKFSAIGYETKRIEIENSHCFNLLNFVLQLGSQLFQQI